MKWIRLVIGGLLVVMIPLGLYVRTGTRPTTFEEPTDHAASYTPEPYEPGGDDGISSHLVFGGVCVAGLAVACWGLSAGSGCS